MRRFLLFTIFLFVGLLSFGQDLAYPSLYQFHNLPEHENATIKQLSRVTDNLRDGIKIFLESPDDYITLRQYYESVMFNLEWELLESNAVSKMREMGKLDMIPFSGEFVKEGLKYMIFTTRIGSLTKINITLVRVQN
ncbi:MAG: hypothetical protein V3V00_11025 [Saprospiraceae bacterium]